MASEQIGLTCYTKNILCGKWVPPSLKASSQQKNVEVSLRTWEALHAGHKHLEGFFQQDKYGARTFNQHLYDPRVLALMLNSRLHGPLTDCFGGEPEGIQTMHFYEGSEHPLHQDQYYLPDCMSAWIAMVRVDADNGPLIVQPGSHNGRLITKKDVPMTLLPGETYELQQHNRYFPAVKQVFEEKWHGCGSSYGERWRCDSV